MKKVAPFILLAAAISAAAFWWFNRSGETDRNEIVLYGNVDLRQVNLAFNGNERIEALFVEEGDRVKKGDVLGTLEMERLKASLLRAEALVEAQSHAVERLENGTRPEEIAQAEANVHAAEVDLENARRTFERLQKLSRSGASSQQDLENAQTTLEVSKARLRVSKKALELAVSGPRKEDIAEARAMLRGNEAEAALLRQDLAYATLRSPVDGIVQNRISEPGEMASPQRPVLTLALTDPKWVRAYVPEPDLGKIRLGMNGTVGSDSFPQKKYDGWVGFLSPVAEFTPKSVETTELRTSLVYEVRIFVKDPADELRLGMPVTVRIPLNRQPADQPVPASEKEEGVRGNRMENEPGRRDR
ncbi:MAG: HlyD family efflux transporter periplasmic adaptor subunit [Desulfobacteraceae bacterium]|nr:MAG: HlyD family efflux transporter periplasmic adaptor subunit [Desulfobacteraceae bacterium]